MGVNMTHGGEKMSSTSESDWEDISEEEVREMTNALCTIDTEDYV